MYKIVLCYLDRWFDVKHKVEYTGKNKDQMMNLFERMSVRKMGSRDDVYRRLVYDESEDLQSPDGKVILEVKY